MRNFYIEAEIDGRKTVLSGGPASKTGGMYITIYQRKNGEKVEAVEIFCHEEDGDLVTEVSIGGELAGDFTTER